MYSSKFEYFKWKHLWYSFCKYTSCQYNGNSVVDYCIASEGLIEYLLYFHVHNHIPHLSDHAKLSVNFSSSFSESNKILENNARQHVPNSYKWLKDSAYLFQKAFDTNEIKQMVRTLMDPPFVVDNNVLSSDQAVDNFNIIIYITCSKLLKQVIGVSNRKSKK